MSAQKFFSNIKTLRIEAKLSQRAFSEKIGIELKRYAKWEERRSQPDIDNIEIIADAHGTTVNDLLNGNFCSSTTIDNFLDLKAEDKRRLIGEAKLKSVNENEGIAIKIYELNGFYIEEYFHKKYRRVIKWVVFTKK